MTTTSESFINYLIALQTRHFDLRMGQHMFNTLVTHNSRLVEDIREQSDALDPFYNDSKVPVFLNYIVDNWNKYEEL